MAAEENLNKIMYKLLLLVLKGIPVVTAIIYILNTALSYCYIDISIFSSIAGMSALTWLFIYVSEWVFRFCIYHRMFMYYILETDIINAIDYNYKLPIDILEFLMIFNVILGIILLLILGIHVKCNKRITIKDN